MYVPVHFAEPDPSVALAVMRENPFATIVSGGDEVYISQVPALVGESDGRISVRFHLAARNPQCATLAEGGRCVVLFAGPHSYVSPTWYAEHPNVPTWNYVSVEVRGAARRMEKAALDALVSELTELHEGAVRGTWRYGQLPDDFRDELLSEITGFYIDAERVECKLKLSQNRTPEDRRRVALALGRSEAPSARAVAAWMTRVNERS